MCDAGASEPESIIQTLRPYWTLQGNDEIAAFGSFARIWEDAARLINACCADGVSDPMDFNKNKLLDALAHLDSAPAAPSIIKTFQSMTPSATSPPPRVPGSIASVSDAVHTDAYDGTLTKSSVTRTEILLLQLAWLLTARSSPCLLRSNLFHLAPKVSKSASITSLTEESHGLRTNKILLFGRRIKIHFPNNDGRWRKVVEYDDVMDLYVLLMHFAFMKDLNTTAQRLCCERELLGVATSIRTKIVPRVSKFTEPGSFPTCCRAPDYEQWLEAMIKEIKELEKMGCWMIELE